MNSLATRRMPPLAGLVLFLAACGAEPPPPEAAGPARSSAARPAPQARTRPGREAVPGPGGGPLLEPTGESIEEQAGQPAEGGSGGGPVGETEGRTDASLAFTRGRLVGRIYIDAATPRPGPLTLDNIQQRHCDKSGGLPDPAQRSVVTDAAGGLADAVVWVDVPDDPHRPDGQPALVKRANRFGPHVLVVRPGLQVRFENADPCTSTLTFSGGLEFALPMAAGARHYQAFSAPGEIRITDAVHPWMEAWVAVRPGAHVAVTGRDGSFDLPGLPPGEHVLRVWHPTLGAAESTFVLEPGGILRLELRLPAE